MHFIDNINLVAAGAGREQHFFLDLPDIVDAGVRRPVDFQHVHTGAPADFGALGTDAAGVGARPLFAAQGFR
jgi:hypothetical protein